MILVERFILSFISAAVPPHRHDDEVHRVQRALDDGDNVSKLGSSLG